MGTEWTDPIRALAWWMETLPIGETAADIATLVHLVALSVAIATVLELDCRIMRSTGRALTVHDTSTLHRGHRRILAALATLWASGAVLAWIATGGDPSAASPKLAAKAVTVVLLTATALAMGRYALPTIAAHTGAPLLALGLATKLRLATLGALSGAGWATALIVGGSESLASAPATASVNGRRQVGFERRYTMGNIRGGWDSTVCDIGIPATAGVKRRCLRRRSMIAAIPRGRGGDAVYTGISGGEFSDSPRGRCPHSGQDRRTGIEPGVDGCGSFQHAGIAASGGSGTEP